MIGAADIGNCMADNGDFNELAGITPRAVSEVFRLLNERSAQVSYTVEVSMFQVISNIYYSFLISIFSFFHFNFFMNLSSIPLCN